MLESGWADRTVSPVAARGVSGAPGAFRRAVAAPGFIPKGFTLMELMVVIFIIAILVSLAVPSYKDFIIKSRRTEAKEMLYAAAQRQQQWFTQNDSYTTDTSGSGLDIDTTSANGYYTLSIAAGPSGSITTSYAMSATAVAGKSQADDSACGTFTLNSRGQKTVSGSQTQPPCW